MSALPDGAAPRRRPGLRGSIGWTIAQVVTLLTIELAGMAVLARILTPTEMGWYAAAFALVQFARFASNFGLYAVILRADRLDREAWRGLMAVAHIAAAAATAATLGPVLLLPAAVLGAEPRALMLLMLPFTLLNGFAMAGQASLVRDMRFRAVFAIRLVNVLSYQAVAIALALQGWGASSLALGHIASAVSQVLLTLLVTGAAYLVVPRLKGLGETAGFASRLFGITALQQGADTLTPILIGRIAGFAALGVFTRASDIVRRAQRMVREALLPAVMPHVFNAAREGRPLGPIHRRGLSYLSAVVWPLAALLALLADLIVAVLLGSQWTQVPPLLRLLCIGLAALPLQSVSHTIGLALKAEAALLRQTAVVTVAALVATPLLAMVGLWAVCLGVAAANWARALLAARLVMRRLGLAPDGTALLQGIAITVCSCAAAAGVRMLALQQGWPDPVVLLCALIGGGLGWMTGVVVSSHPLTEEAARLLRHLRAGA